MPASDRPRNESEKSKKHSWLKGSASWPNFKGKEKKKESRMLRNAGNKKEIHI